MNTTMDELIRSRRVLITCGTGGVGKTSLSAAIAMRAALLGKKAVVITIDPAKRLANALGFDQFGNQPLDLTPRLKEIASSEFTGSLAAIVPDTRKSFEEFVRQLTSTPERAQAIIDSPIFQIFGREFSGTNEYMALERLLSVSESQNYDCIILDTPPSRNTLTFLNAPTVLAQFFDSKTIRWLVLPANRLFAKGMKAIFSVLEKLTGSGFIKTFFEFSGNLFDVQEKFNASIHKMQTLLNSPETGFLIVTTPHPENLKEVRHFVDYLKEKKLRFDGVALNKVLPYSLSSLGSDKRSSEGEPSKKAADRKWKDAFALLGALKKREAQVQAYLQDQQIPICFTLAELSRDIHTVEDLFHVATHSHSPLSSSGSGSLSD